TSEQVAKIVGDATELCAQRFREHAIALDVEDVPSDLTVTCRGAQITQILLNLLGNAHDAVVGTSGSWVRIGVSASPDAVELSVVDSGSGIPPEIRSRIMEPFFTTKELGKGTGLGLSVSKGLAEANRGTLRYDDQAPHTRFVLRLPRMPT